MEGVQSVGGWPWLRVVSHARSLFASEPSARASPPPFPPTLTVIPSSRVVPIKGKQFTYGLQNFVASSASVVGEVKMGELSSVWYGATLRGEWRVVAGAMGALKRAS